MSCISKELIQKYFDKEATPNEVTAIEKHLGTCAQCSANVELQKQLSQKVKAAIHLMVNENNGIPEFVLPVKLPKKQFVTRKRILYSLSAACIFVLILLFVDKNNPADKLQVTIVNEIGNRVDANLPVTQQEMVIKVIDPHGNVTEYSLD